MITLDNILATKRDELAQLYAPTHDFVSALMADQQLGAPELSIIAEFKRASPSAGDLNLEKTVEEVVQQYEANGARCLSVLTDQQYFKGDLSFIARAKAVSKLPVLRKDFLLDPMQVYESKLAGADAVLLIVAALDDQQLSTLTTLSHELNLQVLMEIHDVAELKRALPCHPEMIGVNCRNLKTMTTDLALFDELITAIPDDVVVVAESGVTDWRQLAHLKEIGYDAVLMGTYFMQRL